MIPRLALLVAILLAALPAGAQEAAHPSPRIVMNLAAHPDDEDALTMSYYRRARNAVVHSIIYTRGEGGQNEIGPELYAALGAIRTAETEAAARHYGTQVRFLNFDDFGYSKHASETFERWGGEEAVTERLVYLIRKLKPDVLFTNHDTLTVGPRTQHGHHQAVGISAYRAMRLAADPGFAPEQLDEGGIDLWQPQRLFLRLWRGGQDTAHVRVPVAADLPAGDRTPVDIAVRGIAEHRSQGFDTFAPRFRQEATYFVLLAEAPGAPPLPPGATELDAGLPPNPHASLADLAHRIDSDRVAPLPPGAVSLSDTAVVAGGHLTITWPASGGARLALSGAVDTTLQASPAVVRIPAGTAPTLPREVAQYDRFVSSPPVQAALIDAGGALVAAGHLPLDVAPDLTLQLAQAVALPGGLRERVLLRPGENELSVSGHVFAPHTTTVTLEVTLDPQDPAGGVAARTTLPIVDDRFEGTLSFALEDYLDAYAREVVITGSLDGQQAGATTARFEGHSLPEIKLPPGLRIGIVRSYERATEAALFEMGASVAPLDSLALANGDFDGLHTVIVDIRAYLVRDDLRAHTERLLEWVRRGGHLVVTYHKTMEWNESTPDPFASGPAEAPHFVPYPLVLGRARVTDASAEVTHLVPDHRLFHAPHLITASDWDGWIQERGLYFPQTYDPAFTELLAMSDPREEPLRSSTLLAQYGDGTYLYTALGWYRQLGAFVPGAYRVFANLISLPLTDGRHGI
jgi:LmbE family N-acetylglucosaminyl deacetylase